MALALVLALGAQARADAPLRRLVFTYEVGLESVLEQQTSGMQYASDGTTVGVGGAALQRSSATISDRGTIAADVLAATNDLGLVIGVSEEGRERRKAPTKVALREDGRILAQSSADLSDEERYLLGLLARGLVPADRGVGTVWRIRLPASKDASDVTTYRVAGSDADILHLTLERTATDRGLRGYDLHVTGTADYDARLLVPTAAKLHAILHAQTPEGLTTVTTDVVLKLEQDSFRR